MLEPKCPDCGKRMKKKVYYAGQKYRQKRTRWVCCNKKCKFYYK